MTDLYWIYRVPPEKCKFLNKFSKILRNSFKICSNFEIFLIKKDFLARKNFDICEKWIRFLILCIVLKNETSLLYGGLQPPDPLLGHVIAFKWLWRPPPQRILATPLSRYAKQQLDTTGVHIYKCIIIINDSRATSSPWSQLERALLLANGLFNWPIREKWGIEKKEGDCERTLID